MPEISVVIPTYKNRGGLQNAIESVLCQDYVDYEIIVVDDNEANGEDRIATESVMSCYVNNHRIVYIKHEYNKNGAAARNTGIKVAQGRYIAFLDDDDFFLPSKLRLQLDYLLNNPQYDAVYCFAMKNNKCINTVPYKGDVSMHLLLLESNMFTPTLFFKKEALVMIGGFDENFCRHQDYELLLRFFEHGYKIGCVEKYLTIIGENKGENRPCGENLEILKAYFFSKFKFYIDIYEKKERGFANKVYARHYASVCLSHIKHHYYKMAIMILKKYFPLAPKTFMAVVINSLRVHLVYYFSRK